MDDVVARSLKDLCREHGVALLDDAARLEAFLRDICPGSRAEIHCLVLAVREGAVAELREGSSGYGHAAAAERLAGRLRSDLRYDEEAASWTAAALAGALPPGVECRARNQVGYCLSCHETVAVAADGAACSICGATLIDVREVPAEVGDVGPGRDPFLGSAISGGTSPIPAASMQSGDQSIRTTPASISDTPSTGRHVVSPKQKAPEDFMNGLDATEKLLVIEGIGTTRTKRTRVLLERLVGSSDSRVAAAAAGLLKEIGASPGSRAKQRPLMTPAEAALSIRNRRRPRQLRSLGVLFANPTQHNREVLHGLARGEGRLALDAKRMLADIDCGADSASAHGSRQEHPR